MSAIPRCDMHSVTPSDTSLLVFGLLCVSLLVQYVHILFAVLLKLSTAGNTNGPIGVGCFCSFIVVQPSGAGAQLCLLAMLWCCMDIFAMGWIDLRSHSMWTLSERAYGSDSAI